MATKFVNPEVPYLKPECLLAHTNAVLTCSDGVKLRSTKLVLVLHPRPKSVFLSVCFSRVSLYLKFSGFCGTFCFPCQSYQIAERMGKSGIVYGLLGWILPFVPPLIMRGDLRDLNNIEGSTCNDALAACCCTCCASIQIANELDSRQGKQ